MRRQLRRLGLAPRPAPHRRHHRPGALPLDPVDLPADLQLLVRRRRGRGRAPARSPSWSREFASGERGRRRTARAVGRADRGRAARGPRRRTGWPTSPRRRSTGAPAWAPCWPTRRSPPTGRTERGNFPVFKRNLRQWMMRITAYADRLVDDLDRLDWPESVKLMQRNWIGRSEGAARRLPGRRPTARRRSRSSPPGPTRCSARPTWCWPPSTRWSTRSCRGAWPEGTDATLDRRRARRPAEAVAAYRARGRRARPTSSGRPRARTRPASSPAPSRPTRSTARGSRSSSPTTC